MHRDVYRREVGVTVGEQTWQQVAGRLYIASGAHQRTEPRILERHLGSGLPGQTVTHLAAPAPALWLFGLRVRVMAPKLS